MTSRWIPASIAKRALAVFTLVGVLSPLLCAQSAAPAARPAHAATASRYQPNRFAGRAGKYYPLVWGVDKLSVKAVESGELIRFSWEVVDPVKAAPISDKKIEAYLIAPEQHLQLVVPSLEKVGQLRQSSTPDAGRSYWMTFSNPRRQVKRGDRVNVAIGEFHAMNLIVE